MKKNNKNNLPNHGHDLPWMIRTYSGHSSAKESNKLYKMNLAKGQTGLSVAFDLPTQTGYDSDHPLSKGEVGKVGVPICHLGDMMTLFQGLPLGKMNTSMTINAPAPWLLALYIATAEKQGFSRKNLSGTTQNDLIKEYLSRGTYIFPPKPSLKITSDVVIFTAKEIPKWNPTNICSYHLQEAGATPVQELSFALATACSVLDEISNSKQLRKENFPKIVGRISFFVNAGMKFITELCKMHAFTDLWDEICRKRYKVKESNFRRFRYGVQVNSLGLTEQQPENNVYRILIEMLSVVLSKRTRARAIQLPAWNEALGLPRPWDQQWSLRLQQIMALETDILEYEDVFQGSEVIKEKVDSLRKQASEEIKNIMRMGGIVSAVETGYLKQKLVESSSRRLANIKSGKQKIVGVNCFTETFSSPLLEKKQRNFLMPDKKAEKEQIRRLNSWKKSRNQKLVSKALEKLSSDISEEKNIMPSSIECAYAGVTTGEWADVMRKIFGEYRAPTGVGKTTSLGKTNNTSEADDLKMLRKRIELLSKKIKRRPKILVGKPGLDGHSTGAEQIATHAKDCGFEVVYEGIRLTPNQIANTALEESVHVIGLSVLSGSHMKMVDEVIKCMKKMKIEKIPLVVGGIIPKADELKLIRSGVSAVYTPKDFSVLKIMDDIISIIQKNQK